MFQIDLIKIFIQIFELRNDTDALEFCQSHVKAIKEAADAQGWDGEWYRRAYFDDGTPLGARVNQEAITDSLPQSWAIISGEAEAEHAKRALLSLRHFLIREK